MALALIFPGQGAQEPGMGRGLLDAGAPGHELALEASELVGLDLVGLACDAPADAIRVTDVAQPLLLLQSVALLELVPDATREAAVAVAGHSLGEYTALVAAGSLDWREALKLVRERGLAMAEVSSPDQGMSAVLALDEETVATVLGSSTPGEIAVVANLNAPGQVVISGHRARLEALAEPLRGAGARRVMPLQVGGAFHSPLMSVASERLAGAIDAAAIRDGRPQAFNVDGVVRTAAADIAQALKAQLTAPVRWVRSMEALGELGVDRFLELGPGSTLAALGRRILPAATWASAANPAAAREAVAA